MPNRPTEKPNSRDDISRIELHIDRNTDKELRLRAFERRMTKSALLREIIDDALERSES